MKSELLTLQKQPSLKFSLSGNLICCRWAEKHIQPEREIERKRGRGRDKTGLMLPLGQAGMLMSSYERHRQVLISSWKLLYQS